MLPIQLPAADALARGMVSLRQAKGPIVALFAGDSVTFGNSDNNAWVTGANSYATQLVLRSRGRIVQRKQIGIPGNTSAMIVARLADEGLCLPGIDIVFLLQGTNDLIQTIPPATTIRNDRVAVRAIHARGQTAVILAVPPNAANGSGASALNALKRQAAIEEGAIWIDPWGAARDAGGGYVAGASADGTHPVQAQAALAADAILADPAMVPLLPRYGAASPLAGDLSSAIPNCDFAGSYAHAKGTMATYWNAYATGATGGWSVSLGADPVSGAMLQSLAGGADFRGMLTLFSTDFDVSMHAGRRVAFSGRVATAGLPASGGTLFVRIAGSGDAAEGTGFCIEPLFGLTVETDGYFYMEGSVPAGASTAAITMSLAGVSTGGGVAVALGELAIRPTDVAGLDIRSRRVPARVRHLAASATLGLDDAVVLVDATAGPVTLTLPGAGVTYYGFGAYLGAYQRRMPGSGLDYTIVKVDGGANAVTVAAPAATTIEGAASIALAGQWSKARLLAAQPGLFVRAS